jgi:hypothetical protein
MQEEEKRGDYLAQAGSKNYDLVHLPHLLQEVVHSWPFNDIDIMPVVFDFHGNHIISL